MIKGSSRKKYLSIWHLLLLALIIIGALIAIYHFNHPPTQAPNATDNNSSKPIVANPWFAPYVDVTLVPQFDFEKHGKSSTPNAILAFIVSSNTDPCEPSWGTYATLDQAATTYNLDQNIKSLRQNGGQIAVSFGGQTNSELAINCIDPDQLYVAYDTVIKHYNLSMIDIDLEGDALKHTSSLERRSQTIAKLQANYQKSGTNLAVWLTLPVAPFGLPPEGLSAVKSMLSAGVNLSGINIMTMNYGSSRNHQSVVDASLAALEQTHHQLNALYEQNRTPKSSIAIWKMLGATPMIGQNDIVDEVFTLTDAIALNEFGFKRGIGRLSMWSANRDAPCHQTQQSPTIVSNYCSGVESTSYSFSQALGKNFNGKH